MESPFFGLVLVIFALAFLYFLWKKLGNVGDRCTSCGGSGYHYNIYGPGDSKKVTCPYCSGSGKA